MVALRAADPLGSETESVSFELDRFDLNGDQTLVLRGRWFGIRGRRFMRPTLTMRIDGAKHRLLADLEHKPWAAEEGEEWVASFSPVPSAGDAEEIELAVAPGIVITLTVPGAGGAAPAVNHSAARAGTPARRAPRRKSQPDPAHEQERAKVRDPERAKVRDPRRQLEGATAESARLVAERDALIEERDRLRRERSLFRKRVRELQRELRASQASADAGLAEAQERLEEERTETSRLHSELAAVAAERDRLAAQGTRERETVVVDRDRRAARVARELDAVVAERDRLAAPASERPAVRAKARPVTRPVRREGRPHRVWAHRALAVIALCSAVLLCAAVLALGLVLHVV